GRSGQAVLPDFVASNALGRWQLRGEAFNVVAENLFRVDDPALSEYLEIRHDHCMKPFFAGASFESKNGNFPDARRLQVVGFDLFGINIFAVTEDDDFFLAPGDEEISVSIEVAEIAGEEPAVFQGGGCSIRTVPVAFHHNGSAEGNLAHELSVFLPRLRVD